MKNMEWFFPENKEAAAQLVQLDKYTVHGGSTGLLMRKSLDFDGIIDLGGIDIDNFIADDEKIEIGAMMTYAGIIENMKEVEPDSILVEALCGSVPYGLLNRITAGGSCAMFPVWSDIMGPLLALDTKIELAGTDNDIFELSEYLQNPNIRSANIITRFIIPRENYISAYFRQRRTAFDYNAFSITFNAILDGDKLRRPNLVVIGCKGKYRHLEKLEDALDGKKLEEIDPILIPDDDIEFPSKMHGTGDYLKHLFQTALTRMLADLKDSSNGGQCSCCKGGA